MNHLVKHLAKEADINLLFTNKDKLEKFAKSIVEHCAKVCEKGEADGWKFDLSLGAAFATEIRNSVNKFDQKK